ncbi:hypothetical protein QOZ80_3AG0213890 [Eleusine coracana subsp. coracana]|nr:hypothetical protein QOZ80_3AG0213890 [Eleusine coracana subsp. coracana]
MSTDRRQACTGPDGPTPRQTLPLDLLLEFAARADATTLVRVAATFRSLRRGILGADFRRRLLAVRAAGRWFDPALLRGVSHTFLDSTGVYDTEVIATYQSAPPRIIDRDILLDLAPVASRDGFLVQRSRVIEEGTCAHMCVCDTLTGHVIHLPPVSLKPGKTWHTPALLTVGAGRSFELLVANHDMEFQTFSSEAGQWSEVRAISEPQPLCIGHRAHPAVLGRTVHWFCFGV